MRLLVNIIVALLLKLIEKASKYLANEKKITDADKDFKEKAKQAAIKYQEKPSADTFNDMP